MPSRLLDPLILLLALLWLSALPDAMMPPLLRELLVQRYGTSVQAAHWFMAVNLIGAALAAVLLGRLRHALPPARLLAAAALVNGALLAAMAWPIGFAATMGLRLLEGAADLVVFAVLFDLIGAAGPAATRGRRLGLGATFLMLALAAGAIAGGRLGAFEPTAAFWVGAIACWMVAAGAMVGRVGRSGGMGTDTGMVADTDTASVAAPVADPDARRSRRPPLLPVLLMSFGDRAAGGLLATSLPLYLGLVLGLDAPRVGGLLGLTLVLMAIGAAPAGALADRFGARRLRLAGALLYAIGIATLPAVDHLASVAALMILLGIAGAALMPTALAIAVESGRGASAMAAYQAAGSAGFFVAVVAAGGVLELVGGPQPPPQAYTALFTGFAVCYVVLNAAAAGAAGR